MADIYLIGQTMANERDDNTPSGTDSEPVAKMPGDHAGPHAKDDAKEEAGRESKGWRSPASA